MPSKKQDVYDPKKDVSAAIRLLSAILQKGDAFAQHIDSQANILIGVSLALFTFSASRFGADRETFFLILGSFSAAAALVALLSIHPPKFMRKRGQSESLMYNKRITDFKNPSAFEKELKNIIGDQDAIVSEYSKEIYNLYKYYYRPKRTLYTYSRNILLIGIIFSVLVLAAAIL